MTKIFESEGWVLRDERLEGDIRWVPDSIFAREDGKRLALEIEEEINVPSFLPMIIEEHKDLLSNTKIVICSTRNTPLDPDTARMCTECGISMYAGTTQPFLIVDPFSWVLDTSPPDSMESEIERIRNWRRIPSILISELRNLRNVAYAPDLRDFARRYETFQFGGWEHEHRFVHEFLMDRLGRRLGASRLFEGLNVMSQLEAISEVILGKREHFLHSFQTFLLGAVIIDHNYDFLKRTYANNFSSDSDISIDLPWIFASLFHDFAYTFMDIESLGPVGEVIEVRPRGISSLYSPHLLGCLFQILRDGVMDPEWIPDWLFDFQKFIIIEN